MRRFLAVLVLTVLALPAAASNDEADTATMSEDELIAIADEVALEVESLRGWKFRRPVQKKFTTEDGLRDYMRENFTKKEYSPGELASLETFLKTVGLLPPDMDLIETILGVLGSQIEGFYDPDSDTFFMVRREGTAWSGMLYRTMLAHELTHALDDQYVELDGLLDRRERTQDAEFALGSVIEGSATALMSRYLGRLQLSGELSMNAMTEMAAREQERMKSLLEAPPYFLTLVGRYTCGMGFMIRGDLGNLIDPSGGQAVGANLLAAVEDLPRSAEQILHPEKYWDDASRDDIVAPVEEDVEAVLGGLGWKIRHRDRAGEALMAILTYPEGETIHPMTAVSPSAWTTPAATGWGGDRFYLLEKRSPRRRSERSRAAVWFTMWDTPGDRDEFVAAYRDRTDPPPARLDLGPRVSVYVFGDTGDRAELLRALASRPPRYRQGTSDWTSD